MFYIMYSIFIVLHSVFDFPFSDKIITQDQKTVIVNFVNTLVCHLNPWSSRYLRVLHNIHSCCKRSWFDVANQSIQTHNKPYKFIEYFKFWLMKWNHSVITLELYFFKLYAIYLFSTLNSIINVYIRYATFLRQLH